MLHRLGIHAQLLEAGRPQDVLDPDGRIRAGDRAVHGRLRRRSMGGHGADERDLFGDGRDLCHAGGSWSLWAEPDADGSAGGEDSAARAQIGGGEGFDLGEFLSRFADGGAEGDASWRAQRSNWILWRCFFHNLQACAVGMALGLIPFLFLPLLALCPTPPCSARFRERCSALAWSFVADRGDSAAWDLRASGAAAELCAGVHALPQADRAHLPPQERAPAEGDRLHAFDDLPVHPAAAGSGRGH